eukprot:829891-Amorphochlora_amoeboformis.AAC.2
MSILSILKVRRQRRPLPPAKCKPDASDTLDAPDTSNPDNAQHDAQHDAQYKDAHDKQHEAQHDQLSPKSHELGPDLTEKAGGLCLSVALESVEEMLGLISQHINQVDHIELRLDALRELNDIRNPNQFSNQVPNQLPDQVSNQVSNQISVSDQVFDQVSNQVRNQ